MNPTSKDEASKKEQEYKIHISKLQAEIKDLLEVLREEQLQKWKLEEKIEILTYKNMNSTEVSTKLYLSENIELLLKQSRQQNLQYQDEIAKLNKQLQLKRDNEDDLEYTRNENRTLKAFIVAQNESSHYRRAFDSNDLTLLEQICRKCSKLISSANGDDCSDSISIDGDHISEEKRTRNGDHSNEEGLPPTKITGRASSPKKPSNDLSSKNAYNAVTPDNQVWSTMATRKSLNRDKRNSKLVSLTTAAVVARTSKSVRSDEQNKETLTSLPKVNRASLRSIVQLCEIDPDVVDAMARSALHLGDQITVLTSWTGRLESETKATIKYIGNLVDRYTDRIYLGLKLHINGSDIPDGDPVMQGDISTKPSLLILAAEHQSDGSFRSVRYFNIDSNVGYFIHVSNVLTIWDKTSGQSRKFAEFLHRIIDPKIKKL